MATDAQLAANRANALRSTGPKTDAGKERAARNALRHGLTSKQLVVFDETADDFAAFNASIRLALAPADEFEEQLVERIVVCQWRLRRVGRVEAAIVNGNGRSFRERGFTPRADAGFAEAPWKMEKLSRYEAALERALNRAYLMLERRQARRAERSRALP
ncbi:MAG TPA: hypothetical protein VMU06_17870 [Stellaceae bacterium]|nr:hypothetical protein [Stellaceae bacterium]